MVADFRDAQIPVDVGNLRVLSQQLRHRRLIEMEIKSAAGIVGTGGDASHLSADYHYGEDEYTGEQENVESGPQRSIAGDARQKFAWRASILACCACAPHTWMSGFRRTGTAGALARIRGRGFFCGHD
jgi:hypothetical protein